MKKYTPLIILLIISMILPTVVLPTSAASASLNYADPSSPVKVDMSASELLEFLIGTELSDIEKTYLDQTFGDVFSYSEFVPQKKVETVYDFGTLSVSAEIYEYSAEGGKVTWTPTTATIDGKSAKLSYSASSGKYEGKIEGMSASDGAVLTVSYTCSLDIGADVANKYANYTYDQAMILWNENEEYEKAQAAYEARQKYLSELEKYNVKNQAYDKYVSDKAKYDKNLAAFEQYEKDLAEYKTKYDEYKKAKEEFDKALKEFEKKKKAYETYLEEKKVYEEELKKYQVYMAAIEKFSGALEVLDSVFTYDSQGRQLYGLLTGGTVDYVLATMEEKLYLLEGTNVTEDKVRETGEATEELQQLLDGYRACSTTEQKVLYYKGNYRSIASCFSTLSDNLYFMFHDPTLHSYLYKNDPDHSKFFKFMHMLAQLHVTDMGLDDIESRNDNWYVDGEPDDPRQGTFHKYSVNDLLESVHIITDKNTSDPSNLGEIPDIVLEPWEPFEVEAPGEQPKDPGLQLPVEPDAVKDPGEAPAVVEDPGEAPKEVEGPDTAPELLHHTAEEKALIAAIDNGTLKSRGSISGKTMTLSTEVTKTLVLEDKCIVTFYDHDGKTVLYTVTLDKGDKITYAGDTPERAETDKNKYEFEGWKNEDGELLSVLGTADEQHIDFYASYKAEVKSYTITWIVNGNKTEEKYLYGDNPKFKGELTKPQTEQHTYSFAGWSSPLAAVTGDATYEAVFTEAQRKYVVTWEYGSVKYTESYNYGDMPSYKHSTNSFIDGQYLYEFARWDRAFEAVTGDVTYSAVFTKTNIFDEDDNQDGEQGGSQGGEQGGSQGGEQGGSQGGEQGGSQGGEQGGSQGGETPEPTIKVELEGDTYKVTTVETSAKIEKVLEFAEENENTVTVYFDKLFASVVMNEAMVSKLVEAKCNSVNIYINEENVIQGALGTYSVSFTDKNGDKIDAGSVTLRLELDGKASESTKAYTVDENGETEPLACVYENGAVTVKIGSSAEVVLRNEYKVTASKCENGVLSTDKVNALAGETVKVSLTFSDAYEIVFIKVIGAVSGTEYALSEDNTFTMPEEDITVTAEVKAKEYTVKFVVDGVVISEEKYKKGDTVNIPEDPTKEREGQKVYTFIGWSPAVTIVSEDVTYTAEFSEADLGVERPPVNTDRTRLNTIIAIAVIGIVLVVGGVPTAIILIVRYNKKKKAQISDDEQNEEQSEKTDE